jgi:hypothetical protein
VREIGVTKEEDLEGVVVLTNGFLAGVLVAEADCVGLMPGC